MVSLWNERTQRNYDALADWFGNVRKNPLAYDNPKAQYLRQFVPFVSNYDRASYNWDKANEYMDEHGLTWDDIDPIKLADHFSLNGYTSTVTNALKMSRNVLRLYD